MARISNPRVFSTKEVSLELDRVISIVHRENYEKFLKKAPFASSSNLTNPNPNEFKDY